MKTWVVGYDSQILITPENLNLERTPKTTGKTLKVFIPEIA